MTFVSGNSPSSPSLSSVRSGIVLFGRVVDELAEVDCVFAGESSWVVGGPSETLDGPEVAVVAVTDSGEVVLPDLKLGAFAALLWPFVVDMPAL